MGESHSRHCFLSSLKAQMGLLESAHATNYGNMIQPTSKYEDSTLGVRLELFLEKKNCILQKGERMVI